MGIDAPAIQFIRAIARRLVPPNTGEPADSDCRLGGKAVQLQGVGAGHLNAGDKTRYRVIWQKSLPYRADTAGNVRPA